MANLKELLQEMVTGSEEHLWNGIVPDCVALIFVRCPDSGGLSHLGQQALVCNSYPITETDANEYNQRFCEPAWQYIGLIFAYRHPEGGTYFEAHPDPDFGEKKWIQMLKAPVYATGLTYREKIECRLLGLSYKEYLAHKNEEGAMNSKEPGPCATEVGEPQWRVPSLNQTAGLRSAQEVTEATMKGELLDDLPKHECPKPGGRRLGFAPLDFDVMKPLIDRGASNEEINSQVKAWIAADAAKNPIPTEPESETFRSALLSNTPFAIYCTACLQLLCLIHPEQVKEYEIENPHKDDLAKDAAIENRKVNNINKCPVCGDEV